MCNICNKLGNIYSGYKNIVTNNIESNKMYDNKIVFCNTCSHKVLLKIIIKTKYYKCSLCDCPLEAKLRSNSKCDLNKF
jgi:hypothetical protein